MDLGLKDAVVVVQGGSRGMGRASAECFARDGARVGILGRTQADLDEAVAALKALGAADAAAFRCDVGKPDEVEAAFAAIGARWGHINTLVNVSGPDSTGTFDELSDEDWLAVVNAGTLGMVRCVRAALPLMRKAEWGRIVNFAAHSVKRQSPTLIGYTADKAMIVSVTKNLSMTLAREGILANTVCPGSFASPALKGFVARVGGDPDDLHDIMRKIDEHFGHPAFMPRAGDPAEMGPVVAFLGSKVNSYMTGAMINVDGGSDFS
ncbi:SDR family NAD(P)-dependent oxidoreductase [Novosphingobium bradum]|uniref:SDR family NAD(P)-dependent oxidoreductase n=1 Tax=Novosphingobium bradum TaxID=1737444 RepID=A0ABV7IR59_9SPHN